MPTMYAKVNFSIEFIDEQNNPQKAVEAGFLRPMPASVISVGRGDASFRLESDAIVTGNTSLKYKSDSADGKCYVLECSSVYKCAIKPACIEEFLDNSIPAELGGITFNNPETGNRINLVPGEPIKGIEINEESGPWGRMGAVITRTHLNIDLVASKAKPKDE